MITRRSAAIVFCIVAAVCAICLSWQNFDIANSPAPAPLKAKPETAATISSGAATAAPIKATSQPTQSAFAQSLRGTQRDGKLRADENGNLIIERGTRDLFDYYLTTLGEHDIDAIYRQLTTLFSRELPGAAALQATQLLDAYMQYRKLSGELQQQYPALDEDNAFNSIADYFAQRDELRNQLFEREAIDAFFAADQINEREALTRLQQLTGTKILASDAAEMTDAQNSYAKYRAAMHDTIKSDSITADRDALRIQLFGRDATDRLAILDQQRNDWAARLSSYRQQKQQLLAAATEAGIDPSTQLTQLQQSQFNEREILRVRALDKFE